MVYSENMTKAGFVTPEDRYPVDYREEVVAKMFENIKMGESFSLVGMKDNARINVLRFIWKRKDVWKKYLEAEWNKYIYIFVDLNELEAFDMPSFYKVVANSLPVEAENNLKSLKNTLSKLCQDTKKTIVLMFNNFDQAKKLDLDLIYHQLTSLRSTTQDKLVFIFTGCKPFELDAIFFQKIVFLEPLRGKDAQEVVERNCDIYGIVLDTKTKERIISLTGGHAGLIKFSVQILSKLGTAKYEEGLSFLCQEEEIIFQCQRIASSLDNLQIAKLKTNQKDDLLCKMGFQRENNGKIEIFSLLFASYLQLKNQEMATFIFDEENNKLYYFGKEIGNILSAREFKLLKYMTPDPNKIYSREELMSVIWDEEFYSDWALDKFLSRLRGKLVVNGGAKILKTSRGNGVSLG